MRAVRDARGLRGWVILSGGAASLGAAGVLVHLMSGADLGPLLDQHGAESSLLALLYALLAGLVLTRVPGHTIGVCAGVVAASCGLDALARGIAFAALERQGTSTLASAAAWTSSWANVPSLVVLGTFFVLLFPDGRVPARGLRWVVPTGVTSAVLKVVAAAGSSVGQPPLDVLQGAGVGGAWEILDGLGTILLLLATTGALLGLVVRYRRAQPQQDAIRWFAAAVLVMTAGVAAGPVVELVSAPLVPAAVAVGVLRRQLFDADALARRALSYAGLTAVLAALWVGAVLPLSLVAPGKAPLLASAFVAAVAATVRERLQRAVNRMLYGSSDEPYEVLRRLAAEGVAPLTGAALLQRTAAAIAEALRLPYVAVVDADGTVGAEVGRSTTDLIEVPMNHRGARVGMLTVAGRAPGERLRSRDLALLADVAGQLAPTVAALRLDAELAHAHEVERDRIRRDLHDRLGPTLSGVLLRLDAASASGDTSHVRAARQDLEGAVADVRRLIDALEPTQLGELGLVAALELHPLLGCRPDGLQVELKVDHLPALPAEITTAAYLVVVEAVTNVVRHAAATRCEIWIRVEGSELVVTVRDNGRGGARPRRGGLGMVSMARRVHEVGGTFDLHDEAGTVVTSKLPLVGAP